MALVIVTAMWACGASPKPPVRGVIEGDLDGWKFRRYQSVLDVEVWVQGNKAVAHTASYARASAEKRGKLDDNDVVNAFVTRYERDDGVRPALLAFVRRLANESGYKVEEREIEDVRVVEIAGAGERWALWPAAGHVVKIGGRGLYTIPVSVVEAYGERYPSRLEAGALDRPLDPQPAVPDEPEPFDPDQPRPEWNRGKRANETQ